ncbi:hypothetical protein [Flavivirga spongiicola]|uniref:Zinc ribbon domain-containing protein n=1 Tax=Flavivirga spongiicola TaxID=421621 RepID=A0ABU7XNI7_9FLAO|nr:hypothetical protein [Flavivirga sp. MEBiC05379]MDO5977332.1 hypothetical protein [Flavivirga sp. MEBiC05379]
MSIKKTTPTDNSVQGPEDLPEPKLSKALLKEFIDQFNAKLKEINDTARSSHTKWRILLEQEGIEPSSEKDKQNARQSKQFNLAVAFPAEYRKVLQQLQKNTQSELESLQNRPTESSEASKLLDSFNRFTLSDLVTIELQRYLGDIKPKVSMADVFANAAGSLNKYSAGDSGDKSYSVKCKTCGAARSEEEQYGDCFYCGTPLF